MDAFLCLDLEKSQGDTNPCLQMGGIMLPIVQITVVMDKLKRYLIVYWVLAASAPIYLIEYWIFYPVVLFP